METETLATTETPNAEATAAKETPTSEQAEGESKAEVTAEKKEGEGKKAEVEEERTYSAAEYKAQQRAVDRLQKEIVAERTKGHDIAGLKSELSILKQLVIDIGGLQSGADGEENPLAQKHKALSAASEVQERQRALAERNRDIITKMVVKAGLITKDGEADFADPRLNKAKEAWQAGDFTGAVEEALEATAKIREEEQADIEAEVARRLREEKAKSRTRIDLNGPSAPASDVSGKSAREKIEMGLERLTKTAKD